MPTDPVLFEREVAELYRSLGGIVRQDVSLAGNQIDLVVDEDTTGGSRITRVVECKAYTAPVGVQQVRTFALTARLLRERRLADVATLVSRSGFSRPARDAAAEFGIELAELSDLQQAARLMTSRVAGRAMAPLPTPSQENKAEHIDADSGDHRRVFAAMPFTPRFDDVYLFGVRAAAEEAGVTSERADDNLDSSEIIEFIKSRIVAATIVIVDTTEVNANVFYELGYADGLRKPVVLIAEATATLPFDLQGRNHLLYTNIGDLRAKLASRLRHRFQ